MDLSNYRNNDSENMRTEDLVHHLRSLPKVGDNALDIGARDGHFPEILTTFFGNVTALDLKVPNIKHENIHCVQGDATALNYGDNSFESVFCAEVLEHIPISNPYKQDIRVARTSCVICGKKNPPWGHVNCFDEKYIFGLFPTHKFKNISFVGETEDRTNPISTFLMYLSGNPLWHLCAGRTLHSLWKQIRSSRSFLQKVSTKISLYINNLQNKFNKPHPNWVHILFEKNMNLMDRNEKASSTMLNVSVGCKRGFITGDCSQSLLVLIRLGIA